MALRHVAVRGLAIHCFELGCETFKILREFARGDDRVKLTNIALGKGVQGEGILHFDRAESGPASLTPRSKQ